MSFTTLKKEELLRAVEYFEVPGVTEDNTRPEIIAALEEADVSWTNYKKFVAPKDGVIAADAVKKDNSDDGDEDRWYDNGGSLSTTTIETAVEKFEEMVLLKMTRANGTFEIRGHKFTRQQPFKLLSAGEAQEVIDQADKVGGGFRIASPAEAKSFFN